MFIQSPDSPSWRDTTNAYRAAFGPLAPVEPVIGARFGLAGRYRGESMWLLWFPSNDRGSPMSLQLALPLGGRPVHMGLYPRKDDWDVSGPQVTTGDPAFDAAWIVSGVPPEVVARALDPELRQHIMQRMHARQRTMLSFREGFATVTASFHEDVGIGHRRRPPTPQEATALVAYFHHVVSALRRSYDEVRAGIVARQGEPAAAAWQAQWEERLRAARRRSRLLVVGCTIAVLLVVAAIVAPILYLLSKVL
jgi:hypothetical protein